MIMNKRLFTLLACALIGGLQAFSCAKSVEEEAPEEQRPQPSGNFASVEAYIVQPTKAGETKTDYTLSDTHAYFHWVDELDHIDVTVTNGTTLSSVAFTKMPDEGDNINFFRDGQISGQATMADKTGYELSDWAFYPSRMSPEAQDGDFKADWSYEGDVFKMDLPVSMRFPTQKPLAVVPLIGKRDADGKYAFDQITGVLAVPVNNLPDDADFISITSEGMALAGCFTLTEAGGVKYIAARAPANDAEKTLTLRFSGLSGDQIFYFPVPVGTIPGGMVLTAGNSAKPEEWMIKANKKVTTITRGNIVKTPALEFTPRDLQWQPYGTGTYKDDFIWGQLEWGSTYVPVTIQRSQLYPEKYRINNPYTVACSQFGYTPYTAGITPDSYFVFNVSEDGTVTYSSFKTGVEEKKSGGKSMQLNISGSNNNVVRWLPSGEILEIQMGVLFTDVNNPGYYYTRNNPAVLHLIVDAEESWESIGTGTFIDHFIWPYESMTEPVECEFYQYSHDLNRFRVAKPYPASDADEWFEFNVSDPSAVTSVDYYTGTTVKDDASDTYWKAVVKNGAYQYNYSNVISTQPNGLPLEVQIGPCYRDSEGTFDTYTDWSDPVKYYYEIGRDQQAYAPNIDIIFPHAEETWTSLGIGRYMDEWFWTNNSFAPYDVEVEVWRSDLDANRYRVANPYTVANTAFKRAAIAGADDYLYLSIDPETGLVMYETLKTGMDRSGSSNRNLAAAHPTTWNAMKGTSIDASTTKVVSGTNAAPEEIQMGGVYYDYNDDTHFYTNNTGLKHLWFPGAYNAGETWSDYCEGTYQDVTYDANINGSDAIGTVDVVIQQSSINSNRYRIANPYRENVNAGYLRSTYDAYLYFQVVDGSAGSLLFFEPFRPGVRMDSDPKELGIWHPVSSNLAGYSQGGSDMTGSSVLTVNTDGSLKKVQLGAHYFDVATPAPGYCYTRQGSAWPNNRIYITFGSADKAVVTAYELPTKSAFHNPVASLSLPNGTLERLVVKISGVGMSQVTGLRLWQDNIGGWMNSDYVAPDSEGVVTMESFSNPTISGGIDLNFWLTGNVVGTSFRFDVQEVVVDGVSLPIVQDKTIPHLGGIVVNTGGDKVSIRGYGGIAEEEVASFRIPALVTSNSGTLIAAYDIRYDSSRDLVADIDVGVKRSTDGGKTWSDIILAMDMGTYGFDVTDADSWKNAQKQNGIGDPCLLVDENTGRIFCFAVWVNGHLDEWDNRSLAFAGKGYEIEDTPQLIMVYSDDDGETWSEPVNLTRQIKKYDWRMTFQGPGRGITMKDGTLVIPIQHQEGEVKNMHDLFPLNSGIAYSTDHGETWRTHNFAYTITSESAVAEIDPGKLLLTMRDETDSHYRREYVTTDMGRTWSPYEHNGQMWDSTTEASILKVDADKNSLGQELLIFSSPQGRTGWRNHMTIQVSLDKGLTWPYSLLVDAGASLGYSCLTMVDESTVGILYESSRGNIYFQAIPLTDIVK